MSRFTVPADDPRYEGDRHPAGPIERAIDKAVEKVTGRCSIWCGDVECPAACKRRGGPEGEDDPPPPPQSTWEERQSRSWGVINPDGSVTAKGRMDDPDADADQEVHPPGSLAWYCGDGWYCMATGRPASEGIEPVRPLSSEEIAHRQKIRETQRQHPGELVCVLCASVPCSCTRCPTCGMTEQAQYGGCPRGCGQTTGDDDTPTAPNGSNEPGPHAWALMTSLRGEDPRIRLDFAPDDPPTSAEVCGICDQPASAHPKADHSPEGYDPEDGHHYCPKGRRCPACQDVFPKPSTASPARPSTAPTTAISGAAMSSAVSYGSLKARVLGIADNLNDAQGPLNEVLKCLDDQIAQAQAANEESSALTETLGTLMQAKQHCEDALGMIGAANGQATSAAAGLA